MVDLVMRKGRVDHEGVADIKGYRALGPGFRVLWGGGEVDGGGKAGLGVVNDIAGV